MHVTAVVVAGGLGRRIGGSLPKQFQPLDGVPILARTLRQLTGPPIVDAVVVVVPPGFEDRCQQRVVAAYRIPRVEAIIPGGTDRQESVFLGIQRATAATDVILIHDGVRPFVCPELLQRIVESAWDYGAAVAAVPVRETVKVVDGAGCVVSTPDRRGLWLAQTPQAFRAAVIREAHRVARADGVLATDDAALVERMHKTVRVVEGSVDNIKITTPQDLDHAREILSRWERVDAGRHRV
ncbi:MAG: 2-C-methyl-D-erythritol 4-phosphate cytidylyltransferase [Candidatus Methylomirabilales bacterium]